ncbi:hypothetical protein Goshw_010965 [Gossypium schwendimanii]|uniref:BAH domain-containing protein n=1 Tax=Gossypium schwendimanii TaxID=34291 RepID=A0A7J9KKN3_GOSSC|nr:hypothetical protein [Gossypium schwendimanii]
MAEVENIEFKWGKKRGIGARNRDVQFYESFTYDGLCYTLYDNVYLHKEGHSLPFLGKLIKIWENPDKSKKVKILWFFRPSEISKYLKVELNHPNEVFLASGDGVGLFNINPLEAIVGKCNVVCISKDSRNPQPSDQELQKADFVFCRTFNVKRCIIVDEMDEKIAGIDVKFIFNRMGSLKPPSSHNTDVDDKHTSETAMAVNKKVILSNKLNSFETQNFEDRQGEQKPVVEETFAADDRQESVFNYKSASSLKAEENKELKVDEKLKSIEDLGELDERPYKKAKLDSFGKVSDCKNEIDVLVPNIIASEDEPRCAANTNGTSNSSTKLELGNDELTKPTCKLPNESSSWPSNDIIKTDGKALEVISRPDFEIGVLELSPSFLSFCLSLATWSSNVH